MKTIKNTSYGLIVGLMLGSIAPVVASPKQKRQSMTSLREKTKKVIHSKLFKVGVGVIAFILVRQQIRFMRARWLVSKQRQLFNQMITIEGLRNLIYPGSSDCYLDGCAMSAVFFPLPKETPVGAYRVAIRLGGELSPEELRRLAMLGPAEIENKMKQRGILSIDIDFSDYAYADEVYGRVIQLLETRRQHPASVHILGVKPD